MSLQAIRLRPARPDDAEAVVALLAAEGLEAAFVAEELVVALEGERVVGCARLKPLPEGHELASVAVAPDRRGLGLGDALVRRALAGAAGPVHALALAPGFFARHGFTPTDDLPDALRAKVEGACSGKRFTPMARAADPATQAIRARYAAIARTRPSCCVPGAASAYAPDELAALPPGAELGLGTGNPVRAAAPQPGETFVDLGSGAGVDVLLAARAVGPAGRAIGVDFTREMVERARRNAAAAGADNVELHLAPIERLPLPDAVADAVTSNCVINLSLDKPAVLREAHRVLRPGGRLVVSDTLRLPRTPTSAAPSCDCTTGALAADAWAQMLAEAGFEDVALETTDDPGASVGRVLVRARKPAA